MQTGRQARIPRQSEDVVHAVLLAPGHQTLAGEAGVCAQHDLDGGPALADARDDARHLVRRASAGVDVGAPQLGRQQVVAAEDVERQVAVAVVIAVEEAAFLMAVQRVVGGVQVEDQPLRGLPVGVEKEIDEEPLDRACVVADAAVAMGARRLSAILCK